MTANIQRKPLTYRNNLKPKPAADCNKFMDYTVTSIFDAPQ